MNFADIRKVLLKVFIGFLGLTAIVAIITVLGGEFGQTQLKILATSFTISAASICAMSCAAFIEIRKMKAPGITGILLSTIGALMLIAGLWSEVNVEEYWKLTVTLIILAVAFSHIFLLLLPNLDDHHKWVQSVSIITIGILTVMIVAALWQEIEEEGFYRILAVVAIIAGLETLVVPILIKLRKSVAVEKVVLVLEKIEGNVFADTAGKKYNVTAIETRVEGNGNEKI